MRKSQSPVRAVKKVIAKAKARATRKKTQSAKEARALTSRVRQAMPKKNRRWQKKVRGSSQGCGEAQGP